MIESSYKTVIAILDSRGFANVMMPQFLGLLALAITLFVAAWKSGQ